MPAGRGLFRHPPQSPQTQKKNLPPPLIRPRYATAVMADSPLAYWRLGESSGTTAVDIANGHNGTYSAVVLGATGAVVGDNNTAVVFNGSSSSVDIGAWEPSGDAAWSMEAWIKTTSATDGDVIGWGTGSTNQDVIMRVTSTGSLFFASHANAHDFGGTSLIDGYWHHIVLTYAGGGGTLRGYVDGKQQGTDFTLAARNIAFGGAQIGVFSAFFTGSIDDVAIYGVALTATQVRNHFVAAQRTTAYQAAVIDDGATSYWRLGEPSGTSAVDQLGLNNGTYVGTPTLGATGALAADTDKAVTLNGTTQYIRVTDSNSLDLGNGPYSYELWFKRANTTAGSYYLFAKGTQHPAMLIDTVPFALGIQRLYAINEAYSPQILSTANITDTNWHHVVFTKSFAAGAAGNWKIYVDGVDTTVVDRVGYDTASTATDLFIGAENSTPSFPFPGTIDEFAIYPVELTQSQVSKHYALGASAYSDVVISDAPIGYWKLGESPVLPTTVHTCGAECGVLTGGSHWDTVNGTPSLDTSIKHSGTQSYKFGDGASSPAAPWMAKTWTGGGQQVGHGWFRLGTGGIGGLNRGNILSLAGPSTEPALTVDDTVGALEVDLGAGGVSVVTLSFNTWHSLDWLLDVSTTTYSLSLRIDGLAYGPYTRSGLTAGTTGYLLIGNWNNWTNREVWWDDFVVSKTATDYPIIEGHVNDGPTLVQQASASALSSATLTVNLTNPSTAGNTLIYTGGNTGETISSISGGGTWSLVKVSSASNVSEIWYCPNATSVSTVTVTYAGASGSRQSGVVSEWAGLDGTTTGTAASANGVTFSPTTASITPAAGLNLVIAVASQNADNFVSGPTGGFTALLTARAFTTSYQWSLSAYKIQDTATAASTSWTLDSGNGWDAQIAAFGVSETWIPETTTAQDSSGNSRPGTYVGNPKASTSIVTGS